MIDAFPELNQLDQVIGLDVYRDDQKIRHFSDLYGFIKWLFRFRCVGLDTPCNKSASDVSHIEPGHDDSDWRLIVLHCRECHSEYHHRGLSDDAIENLKLRRAAYLESIGRAEYI